jgi:hypothetical protein
LESNEICFEKHYSFLQHTQKSKHHQTKNKHLNVCLFYFNFARGWFFTVGYFSSRTLPQRILQWLGKPLWLSGKGVKLRKSMKSRGPGFTLHPGQPF